MEERIRTFSVLYAKHFSAQLDTVRMQTGKTKERIKIDHPQAAAVIPFIDSNHIIMVRQWRYAIGRETLEIPAGKVDPGEEFEDCALRELQEETGFHAENLFSLYEYYPAIGYSNEFIRIYAASGLKPVSQELDTDEIAKVEIIEFDHIYDLISRGTIRDGKTVMGISLFWAEKERGGLPDGFFK
ncbi:MAG: NUDIX hydrolase [Syntrophobacteraceae bacterium]